MALVADVALRVGPRLVNELGRERIVVYMNKLALDLWLNELRELLEDVLAEPALVQLTLI